MSVCRLSRPGPVARSALWPALAVLAASCAVLEVDPLPEPLRPPAAVVEQQVAAPESEQRGLRVSPTPGVVVQRSVAEGMADELGKSLEGDPVQVSFHDIPLVEFINAVFFEELGMSFVVAPSLREKKDLVTLRLSEPLPPAQLFATARRVLGEYGVDLRQADGVLTFVASEDAVSRDVPLLVSGRALPEVPPTHRTVFQLVPLKVVASQYLRSILRDVFDDRDELRVELDELNNALLLMGPAELVERALPMIEVLDQPLLHGRHGMVIQPDFLAVGDLEDNLRTVLRAEGYEVAVESSDGAIILVPLKDANKLIVFAVDPRSLRHVEEWALLLDERRQEEVEAGVFSYEFQNTQAEQVVETLRQLEAGGGASRDDAEQSGSAADSSAFVVDKPTNMLIFRGSGREWAELLRIARLLDRPVPSVLIEVVIAEVTLNDLQGSGIEFMLRGASGDRGGVAGTLGKLGLRSSGLSATLNSAGQTRAVLNLFYEDTKVVIRSSPKVMVKSGDTATIDVGNEIPVIVQIAEQGTQIGGSTNVLQQVSYRKTGIQMEITPVVQANGLVDLVIAQQLSEARPAASTSLDGSPTILNRSVTTNLTLRDGGSVLIGGLISANRSLGQNGVPVLGRIPVLGRLFRSDLYQNDRTELVVMVIPYVVADHRQSVELTERIRRRLELHPPATSQGEGVSDR